MPYFMRHYTSFCDVVIVYDDHSTDRTREIVLDYGGQVRQCPWTGLDDIKATEFAAQQLKESRGIADWVIWVDADEFIYHPRILERLASLKEEGITIPRVSGFNMVSERLPIGGGQIYDEIRQGFPDAAYGKPCVIDPRLNVIWTAGKHEVYALDATSNLDDPLKLLHYRYLGDQWFTLRNARNHSRQDPVNIARLHGKETWPGYEGQHSLAWYAEQSQSTVDCLSA